MESRMAKPKYDPDEMPVREVTFAEGYGLTPDQYCELKEKIWNGLAGEAKEAGMKEARAQLRQQLREEIRTEILKEVMPGLKAQAEKKGAAAALTKAREELEPEVRKEMLAKCKEEFESQSLTDGDKKAYAVGLREIEVESLVLATSASSEADSAQTGSSTMSRMRLAGLAGALAGIGPYALWLMSSRDWHSAPFWLTALPYAVLLCYMLFWRPKSVEDAESLRKLSSEYLQLVSASRLARMVSIDTGSRHDVMSELARITRWKSQLDERYQPSISLVEEVKPQVRIRLAEEIDPEKLLADEIDQRLGRVAEK